MLGRRSLMLRKLLLFEVVLTEAHRNKNQNPAVAEKIRILRLSVARISLEGYNFKESKSKKRLVLLIDIIYMRSKARKCFATIKKNVSVS